MSLIRDSLLTVAGVSEQLSSTVLPYSHVHPRAHVTVKHISSKKGGASIPTFDLTKEQSAPSGEAPVLLANVPLSVSLNAGDDLFLSVSAYGSEPLSYQWKKDNVNIEGATSSAYQKLNVQGSDEAVYKCVITNAYGSVISHTCEVTVATVVTEYTVDFTAGTGGSISGSAHQVVAEGGNCTAVEAIPDEGYAFDGWTGDVTSSDNPLTVENVVADMEITANFIAQYTVNFTAGSGGSLTGDVEQVVNEGGDCTAVEAVPNEGYAFSGWTGDVVSSDNPLTVENVVANMDITANFEASGPNMNVLGYYYNQMNE